MAEELQARSFIFELLRNPEIHIERLSKEFIANQFINFVIDGHRGEADVPPQTPPISYILASSETDDKKPLFQFTPNQFGTGLVLPVMVNIDYDSELLKDEFEKWLIDAKQLRYLAINNPPS